MKKIISAPYIDQTERCVNGCESISAVMLLQAMGISIAPDTFIERDLPHAPYWEQDGKLYTPQSSATLRAVSAGFETRNGTSWQRETIVGSTASAVRAMRMNTTPPGGSSMVLSRAFAEESRSVSTRSRM